MLFMSEIFHEQKTVNAEEQQPLYPVAEDSTLALMRRNYTNAIKLFHYDEAHEDSRVGRVSGLSSAEAHAMLKPRASLPIARIRKLGNTLGALSTHDARHHHASDDH
jgi:hypothetical protein